MPPVTCNLLRRLPSLAVAEILYYAIPFFVLLVVAEYVSCRHLGCCATGSGCCSAARLDAARGHRGRSDARVTREHYSFITQLS